MRRRFFNKLTNNIVNNYLTIEALEDNLSVKLSKNACEYCINGDGNWINIPANTETTTINKGQTLSFRGHLVGDSTYGIGTFSINKKCNIKGNCMSMLFGDDIQNPNQLLNQSYAFLKLFYAGTNIISVDLDILPAVTLTGSDFCYQQMFAGCTSLVNAPKLPAIILANECYRSMFQDCTSLVNAPELPATALPNECYGSMFRGCTSLVNAPELPATTLTTYCYRSMFQDCTSLVNAPELPAITLAGSCYDSMFRGCTSLVNAPELPATTLTTSMTYCYRSMFQDCTSLTTAPELPATKLSGKCYLNMFYKCSKLKNITMLATDISATDCLSNWVNGVASTGTFVKHKDMTTLPTGTNGIPNGWTVQDYVS